MAKIAVEESEARTPYSSANVVVITAEGIAASGIPSRSSPSTPEYHTVAQHRGGMHKFLKRTPTSAAAFSRTFSEETMSPATNSESPAVVLSGHSITQTTVWCSF